jgi:hypothetical protein
MKLLLLALVFLFSWSGLMAADNPAGKVEQPTKTDRTTLVVPLNLKPSQFIGYRLTLDSKTAVEEYFFNDGGTVLAALGTKAVHSPRVWHWRIEKDNTLLITDTEDGKGSVIIRHMFRSITATEAVTTDGQWFVRKINR